MAAPMLELVLEYEPSERLCNIVQLILRFYIGSIHTQDLSNTVQVPLTIFHAVTYNYKNLITHIHNAHKL